MILDDTYDKYLATEVLFGGKKGTVTSRKRDLEGNLLGTTNENPVLDSSVYEVTFTDGTISDRAYSGHGRGIMLGIGIAVA